MFLPGRLRSTTLGDVLGRLHRARVSGELELIGHEAPYRGCRHRISVRDGLVTDVRTPMPLPRLGEVLLEDGGLTPEQHRLFLNALSHRGSRLAGEVLIRTNLASPERVMTALGQQNRLRLDALFHIKDADLRFHPLAPKSSSPRLSPADFLYGRPRARDSAKKVSPDAATSTSQAFALLGLPQDASRRDVRRAFRRLASVVHPDLHPHASPEQRRVLESRFASLSSAYHTVITHRPCEHG